MSDVNETHAKRCSTLRARRRRNFLLQERSGGVLNWISTTETPRFPVQGIVCNSFYVVRRAYEKNPRLRAWYTEQAYRHWRITRKATTKKALQHELPSYATFTGKPARVSSQGVEVRMCAKPRTDGLVRHRAANLTAWPKRRVTPVNLHYEPRTMCILRAICMMCTLCSPRQMRCI